MAERQTRELFLGEGSSADGTQHLYVNMGPAHPAMHGIIRIFAELDGETVVKTDVEIGYLHRAFEKDCEGVRTTTRSRTPTASTTSRP